MWADTLHSALMCSAMKDQLKQVRHQVYAFVQFLKIRLVISFLQSVIKTKISKENMCQNLQPAFADSIFPVLFT